MRLGGRPHWGRSTRLTGREGTWSRCYPRYRDWQRGARRAQLERGLRQPVLEAGRRSYDRRAARHEVATPQCRSPRRSSTHPTLATVGELIWNTVARLFHRPARDAGSRSAFVLPMLWGHARRPRAPARHLERLAGARAATPRRRGTDPGRHREGQGWVSCWAGAMLGVAIPVLLMKTASSTRASATTASACRRPTAGA